MDQMIQEMDWYYIGFVHLGCLVILPRRFFEMTYGQTVKPAR
jgi:hypothetical protein